MTVHVRPFDPRRDYPSLAELALAVDPTSSATAEALRYRDQTREARVHLFRLVAEATDAGVVAAGRVMHLWWVFHPRHFQMRIEVHPGWRRRGIGSALFEPLLAELERLGAELVRGDAAANAPDAIAFVEHRGFHEWKRRWESVLDVARANVEPLLDAARRVAASDVTITTYADELARRGDAAAHAVYAADCLFSSDEPTVSPDGDPWSFERFAALQLDGPESLHDGHFLALRGDQIVGLSRLNGDARRSDVLHQDLTATHRDYRGRGIAQALKLRTIQYARARGYREIHTSNETTNAPMIHINDAIGFRREHPRIIFERRLSPS